jgi:hypothetical protein
VHHEMKFTFTFFDRDKLGRGSIEESRRTGRDSARQSGIELGRLHQSGDSNRVRCISALVEMEISIPTRKVVIYLLWHET